jgi:phenylacetyl-CoA:acceptor oxidoreductase subunit 1
MIMRREAPFPSASREEEMTGKAERDGRGVCTKCSFCVSRLDKGLVRGLKPGSDLEASPACVVSCSAGALYFGDLEDPESSVSRLIRENTTARLQEGLGTEPSIFYLVDGLPHVKSDE